MKSRWMVALLAILAVMSSSGVAFAQGAMTNGANHIGAISLPGEIDTWTFTANTGDGIVLAIGETGGIDTAFVPWIRINGPTGTLLAQDWGPLAAQRQITAPSSGTYTVWVASADSGGNDTGTYVLTLAHIYIGATFAVPDQGGALTNGANHPGGIHIGDLDVWTFNATLNSSFLVNVGEVTDDSDFTPWVRVFGPTGTLLTQDWAALVADVSLSAPATGTYTVVVSSADAGVDGAGTYTLTLANTTGSAYVVSPGDQGGAATNGANHIGYVHRGDLDPFTFSATQGGGIVVSVSEVADDNDFTPWIRLYSPAGVLIGQAWAATAAQVSVAAPSTGTYTAVVSTADAGSDASGTYSLTVSTIPGTPTISVNDEGGPLTPETNHTGVIYRADTDHWTFYAKQGNNLAVSIGEVGIDSAFQPWIRLFGPTGTLLGSNWSTQAAHINVAAPTSGTYTVIVGSAVFNDAFGSYVLSVTGTPGDRYSFTAFDFGANGLWARYGQTGSTQQWRSIHNLSPTIMATGDINGNGQSDLIANFAGQGVWVWLDDTNWVPLHPLNASAITVGNLDGVGGDEVIMNFPGLGVWVRTDTGVWLSLHPADAAGLAVGNIDGDAGGKKDLIVNFPTYGVYLYMNNSSWVALHPLTATDIATGDLNGDGKDEIVLNFPGYGVWKYSNGGSWTSLHPAASAGIAIGNIDGDVGQKKDVIINFPGAGVWAWMNNASWVSLHPLNAPVMTITDIDRNGRDDLALSFTGYGIYVLMNGSTYVALHPLNPEGMSSGKLVN